MRRILYGTICNFEIFSSRDIRPENVEFEVFYDHFSAQDFLRRLVGSDVSNMMVLRNILFDENMMCSTISDDKVFDQLAVKLLSGSIRIADKKSLSLAQHFKNIKDVISFIHKEMIKNEKGADVAYIRNNLGVWQLDNLIPGKAALDQIQAYWRWYERVKHDAQWDHKKTIKKNYGEWSYDFPNGILYSFDIWSNIHYGYIGLSAKFDEWSLLSGAGAAQKLAGTNPPEYWKRRLQTIGDADFLAAFDDPDDQEAIKVGFELWKNFKTKVSISDILRAVRNHSKKLKTKRPN